MTSLSTFKSLAIASFILAAPFAHGATLAGFSNGATNPASATTLEPGVTSASLAFGSGIPLARQVNTANSFSLTGDPESGSWNLATAITKNYYYSVTFDIADGTSLDFESAAFQTFSQNDPRNFYLLSSETGFTTSDVLGSFVQASGSTPPGFSHEISLTSSGLSDVTGSIEFRIYYTVDASASIYEDSGFRAGSVGANFISFSGVATAIPEPATAGLLVIGMLTTFGTVRRRSKIRERTA